MFLGVASCCYAFNRHYSLKHRDALILLMCFGFLIRLFTSLDPFLHQWDEQYHALVAKHLTRHMLKPTLYETPILNYDFKNWTDNYIWLHKQPFTLWLISISIKVFGIHAWAIRIPSLVLSTIGVKLVYDIAKHLYDRNVGFIAAFLFSIHGFIIELGAGRTATDHIDVTFLFLVLLSVWFGLQFAKTRLWIYHIFMGVSLGLAILTKWFPALIVVPIYLLLVANRANIRQSVTNILIVMFIAALIALPWQLYILNKFPNEARWEYDYNKRHLSEAIEGHSGNVFYYFDQLRIRYGELIYLPVIWFIYRTFSQRKRSDFLILTWFLAPYLFFSFVATKMPGYTLIAAPAVFAITACAFMDWKNGKLYRKRILVKIATWCLILLPVRYSIERIKPLSAVTDDPTTTKEINHIMNVSCDNDSCIVFNSNNPIEDMFYTSCIAYKGLPDSLTLKQIKSKGYNVLILQK
jgi:4-amino-4-deoxy-L-arabinose transferase-like glycosyltransferase